MFEVTEDWIKAYQSGNGGWNRAQLACIAVEWPPRSGWVKRAVGRQISDESRRQFEMLKGETLQKLRKERRQQSGLLPTGLAGITVPGSDQSAPGAEADMPENVALARQ